MADYSITRKHLRQLEQCQHQGAHNDPCIVRVGDGVIDWFVPPVDYRPAGRYRVVHVKRLEEYDDVMLFLDYLGPIPDTL